MNEKFEVVGIRPLEREASYQKKKWYQGKPIISMLFLTLMVIGSVGCQLLLTKNPVYMDLSHCNEPPGKEFLFGTDTMGRDIYSMIWYGGRISLTIGFGSTIIAVFIATIIGAASGCGKPWLDRILMRFTELMLSIPNLLVVIMLQAFLGKANIVSLLVVIGITSWMNMEQVIRIKAKQIRNSDYVLASRCMGVSFWHVLWKHLAPDFFSSIMFMAIMNVRSAMVAESTLSFMGLGLPIEVVSWGSMLSLADKALLSNAWWIIWIPGLCLVLTLVCLTNIGNYMRKRISGNNLI